MITWIYESDSFETFCWAEMERSDIMIVRTDNLRWRWRLEVQMKGRRPTGECATLDAAKKNALAAYRYVTETEGRSAANEERAAVVAFLREQVASATLYRVDDVSVDAASAGVAMLLAHVANAIERGEHRREEER